MEKRKKICRKILVPALTLAFLVSTWVPGVTLETIVQESYSGKPVIVELYKGASAEAAVDYNAVQKHYDVRIFINNHDNEVKFPEGMGRPFIMEGRTFAPYRVISEALGAQVNWHEKDRKVTASGNDSLVELFIGNPRYKVNGTTKVMDVEPFILAAEGRTYIPARYITEGLSYTIDFAQDGKVMYICSFTKGQTEFERKEALQEIIRKSTNQEVAKPPTSQPTFQGQWGSKYNELPPEKAAELIAYPVRKFRVPFGDPEVKHFGGAKDAYAEILERMPLKPNQAFFSASDRSTMYVDFTRLIYIRGVLQTKSADGSVMEQNVGVSAMLTSRGWSKVVIKDLDTGENFQIGG